MAARDPKLSISVLFSQYPETCSTFKLQNSDVSKANIMISTPLKKGLIVANGVGVIDQDYCGPADEVKIQVLNFTAAPVQITKGDRLAQGLFIPIARADWQEAPGDLRDGSRGGFGATEIGRAHV